TSYLLSRTLVPTMVHYLLAAEVEMYGGKLDPSDPHSKGGHKNSRRSVIWRIHDAFNAQFEKLRLWYGGALSWALSHRPAVVTGFLALVAVSCALFPLIGTDFFPTVDAGQMRLHVRAPAGTRIEQTQDYFARVEDEIRNLIPRRD